MKGQYIILLPGPRRGLRGIEITLYVCVCLCVWPMKTSMCNIWDIYMANNTKFSMWTSTGRRKHSIVLQRNPSTSRGVKVCPMLKHSEIYDI